MKRNEAQVHQIELLLTLDYLLNYTDKDHPATQQDICRHSNDFGLNYDSKSNNGNDVRRQRIGDCLLFLNNICLKYKDTNKIPFSINKTQSGKYYLEKKNNITDEQLIKILAAVKNDKYTKDEDTDLLINSLLDVFSNKYNRNYYIEELSKACKNVNKYSFDFKRKIRLINKAYNENKTIKIRYKIFHLFKHEVNISDCAYRVYKIKEYENKPYVILLRITQDETKHNPKIIFDFIENLDIPKGKDSDIIQDDFDENRDLNQLFKNNKTIQGHYYKDIDNMIKDNVRPQGGMAYIISFYFFIENKELVEQSFENFFSQPLEYTPCSSFKITEDRKYGAIPLPLKTDKGTLIPNELKENEKIRYGVVNVLLNASAFISWVTSNYSDTKSVDDIITVVSPSFIKEKLATYYFRHMKKYMTNLDEIYKRRLK